VLGLERIIVPLLCYWRQDNYRRDLDMGAGFHLNHREPLKYNAHLQMSA